MGLLDTLNNPLIGLAAGLLSGGDPGGTFGGGLSQGLQNMMGMQQFQTHNTMLTDKIAEMKRAREEQEQRRKAFSGLLGTQGQAPGPYQMSESELFPGEAPISGLLNQGQDPTGMYAQDPGMAGLLSVMGPDMGSQLLGQAYLQGSKGNDPTTAMQNFQYLTQLGLDPATALDRAFSGGVNVNVGGNPMSLSDLQQIQMPGGGLPPVGATAEQIAAAGGRIVPEPSPGQKAVDAKFAEEYVELKAKGGFADVNKQLGQLKEVANTLVTGKNITGPIIGKTPDALLSFFNPESVSAREAVEEVVQRSLKTILGGSYTEKEGESVIARSYNPSLGQKENSKRLNRLITQMEEAAKAKENAAIYYETHGTLSGWKGKLFTMDDFDPDKGGSGGASGSWGPVVRE